MAIGSGSGRATLKQGQGFRSIVSTAMAAVGLLCMAGAAAADTPSVGSGIDMIPDAAQPASGDAAMVAQAEAERGYAIAPQPLATALREFGVQSGLQVAVDGGLAAGRQTGGVSGRLPARTALDRLLAGTGLTYRFTDANTVTVQQATANGDSGATPLDPITVEGEGEDTGTIGYVASRSNTASKTDTPLIETPQSISVVTRKQFDDQAAQTVSEALRYTSGVYTQPFGVDTRYDQILIRGFFEHDLGDYRDGLRQVSNTFAYFRTEPYGLQRLDVLKGPTSVLYGQNSPGGLVNRVSKKPFAETRLEALFQFDPTLDKYQGGVDLNTSFDENDVLLGRLVGFARTSDNPQIREENDDRYYVAPSITVNPTKDISITLLGEYLVDHTSYNFWYIDPSGNPTRIWTGDPDFDRFDQVQYQAGYQAAYRASDNILLRQNLRYGKLNIQNDYLFGTIADAAGDIFRFAVENEEDLWNFTVDTNGQFDFKTGPVSHTALAGVDYLYSDWKQEAEFGVGPTLNINAPVYGQPVDTSDLTPFLDTDQTLQQFGVYGQEQMKLFDRLVLTLGGRLDWAKSKTKDNLAYAETESQDNGVFTGRAGITYLFDFGLAPYFSYGTSFLPTSGTDANGSPFEPTEGKQYEVGVKYEPDFFNGFVTASLFDLTQSNVLTPDPDNPGFETQIGEVRSRGFEIEGRASLIEGLDMLAAYTYSDVEVIESNDDDLGKVPVVRPKHVASAWANYTVPTGRFRGLGMGAGVRYVGSSYRNTDNTLENDPYLLFDLAAHYEYEGWRVAVNVANLFDKEYFVCNTATTCYWGQDRTILTTIRYRWSPLGGAL